MNSEWTMNALKELGVVFDKSRRGKRGRVKAYARKIAELCPFFLSSPLAL